MKKPKRQRPAPRPKQVRVPGAPAGPGVCTGEPDAGDRLAGLLRARLALMPPLVAEAYRALVRRDDPTVAEKARLNVLEDTYAPSSQDLQAAIARVQAERGVKAPSRPAAPNRVGGSSGT